jgi:hypothetical protein
MKANFFLLLAFAAGVLSQFPPKPQGVTTVNSKKTPGVSVSYKEVRILSDLSSTTKPLPFPITPAQV